MAQGWPGMAEARLLEVILVIFEGFGGRFGPEVVTVLIIFWSVFSVSWSACLEPLQWGRVYPPPLPPSHGPPFPRDGGRPERARCKNSPLKIQPEIRSQMNKYCQTKHT